MQDVVEWYETRDDGSSWIRAAGLYVRMLSTPQLFIEGNHRTGALLMTYLLIRDGQPPFVLSAANATAYFEASAAARHLPKRGIAALATRVRRRLAALLRRHADARLLITH